MTGKNFPILLIPEKTDIEFEDVFATWTRGGGEIRRLGKYWIRDEELSDRKIAIYGNQAFAFVLAQIYGVELLSPDDTLIARLDAKWTKRNVQLRQIGDVTATDFPVFIKPVIPKIFVAGVFDTLAAFRAVVQGLAADEQILVSSVVHPIAAEARAFIMNGEVKDIALYEGSASLDEGRRFLAGFLGEYQQYLPAVVVVDIAYNEQTGWFVLEFNACWGAGLNNCSAEKVMDCIINATIN
ncbi:ATP-grasp domain-containing protein [Chitinophaga filiformis]|uniref:ATP-grasp domain-containing protein n=1 Tax=Chitinophaga filiformis TaxID=104663 RepID=A0ABY4HUE3_CHIFI|nr:ATP-grasp domain-containing protein [Chitinophaga filiformis]UPK66629.1 ATP-grasp domain-containing protein [Chitinophaga filiformis]